MIGWVGLFLLIVTAAGCATTAESFPQPMGPPLEVDLAFVPTAGMRLAYEVRSIYTLSGEAVKDTPPDQRSRQQSARKVVTVTALHGRIYDTRLSEGGRTFPATLRFGPNWAYQTLYPDDRTGLSEADRAAAAALPDLFKAQAAYYRRWRAGEAQPWSLQLRTPTGKVDSITGTITFQGLVQLDGRQAAEFRSHVRGRPSEAGLPVEAIGQSWLDVATGVVLKSTMKAIQPFAVGTTRGQLDMELEEALDRNDSKGL